MSLVEDQIIKTNIEDELKTSYLDYAMSVIVGRALPDVRDGLKPVHRRVLFAMNELKNDWNKPYKKSARIVGDVIGKYHPHGDNAVYDTIVRMAQDFSMRYLLVDGQGNFGSVDGDSPAAMRYTEVRMQKMAHALLADLEKETVDFHPNYDGTEQIPTVLPTRTPNLLVNGSSGIAVGMATNIPPHNMSEVINACVALIDDSSLGLEQLMEHIPGPDFPTAGILNGKAGIVSAYKTGRGRVYLRARTTIENTKSDKQSIIVTELPYQVNKARLLEKIAVLVKDKKIDGITGLRDESDKDGMRMVIELRRGEVAEVVLNNLYSHTQMQSVFGINMVALIDGQPRTLNLKQLLEAFVKHRRDVVTRRTIYDLRKAKERAHMLEGLAIALANIDDMIAVIKAAKNPAEARENLLKRSWAPGEVPMMLKAASVENLTPDHLAGMNLGLNEQTYQLSVDQAKAILDLKLHRLTGLEQDKIVDEFKALLESIKGFQEILANHDVLMKVIRDDLVEMKSQFGDERRTEIIASHLDLTDEDLITEEDRVVTLSHEGYAKAQPLTEYRAQRRGGKGKSATTMKDDDFIERLVIANTHDTILCFSTKGKVYWLKVYQLPVASRNAKGRPIVNILPIEADEKITAILPVSKFTDDRFVFMATERGTVKKVSLSEFSKPRSKGKRAIEFKEDDSLVGVALTDGSEDVMLFTDEGKVIRFSESKVRKMGRTACGVCGIKLGEEHKVISLIIPKPDSAVLTATENGYGKRTVLTEYRCGGRAGKGVISIQTDERNGKVVGALFVHDNDEIMLISDGGTLVRTPINQISKIGRAAKGVRLINLTKGEKLVGVQRIEEDEELAAALEEQAENPSSTTDESLADDNDIDIDTPEESSEDE